jgi:transposase-like protein
MKQTSGPAKQPADALVKDIRRATRRQFSAEEKIRIVLEGLRGEESSERSVDFVGVSRRLTRVGIEG